jgi:hypothetical protein
VRGTENGPAKAHGLLPSARLPPYIVEHRTLISVSFDTGRSLLTLVGPFWQVSLGPSESTASHWSSVSRALKGRNGGIPDVYRRQADIDRGREGEGGREGGRG